MSELLRALKDGECVLLATDTVYGVAALPSTKGYEEIFRLKHRDKEQVLPWLVGCPDALNRYGEDVPACARALAERFWPGSLTLVVRASAEAKALGCVAADGTVALRMPDEPTCLALLRELDAPIACTSANLHGMPAPTRFEEIAPSFTALTHDAAIPASCKHARSSTILDCTSAGEPQVLRKGPITKSMIDELIACR